MLNFSSLLMLPGGVNYEKPWAEQLRSENADEARTGKKMGFFDR
jgi:hypothetical protein